MKQVAANGDVTAYVGGLYEVAYSSSGTLKNTKLYYAFGGQVVAMRDNGTLYYLHGDNLGSASLTTNASGGVVSQNRYYPFGASRFTQGTRPTDVDFTGQRLDGTGLHFYNARYYASGLGRFVSADTIVLETKNSQAYNRYIYASNNPIKYVDPSGHCWGLASGVRGLPSYGTTCNNLDMASTIIQHPKETLEQEGGALVYALAVGYEIFEWGAHIGLAVGATGLACSAVAPCVKAAEATLGIGTAACADGDCTNEVQLSAKLGQNIWKMNPFDRGWAIERALGRSPQLVDNFPTIDRFENGIATSIKSINLGAQTYQDIGALTSRVQGYVTKLANFNGASYGGFDITANMITGRALLLAIPPNASAQQMAALQQLQAWATTQGVTLTLQVVK